MSWIRSIPYVKAEGELKEIYDRIRGRDEYLDNIVTVHGLRPHTLKGHMELYKGVLHHRGNTLPVWMLEALGVRVSQLNGCEYCVRHHTEGLRRLLGSDELAHRVCEALESGTTVTVLDSREASIFRYAEALTLRPQKSLTDHVAELRQAGLDDGEILEINQVVSYFAYANRTVLGLGVTAEGDQLGLSPGNTDNPEDWAHG